MSRSALSLLPELSAGDASVTHSKVDVSPVAFLSFALGAAHADPRHATMHRTRSVDYAVVIEGEIDMLLDDSEVRLRAGDVLVQRGTDHAWVNRGKQNCRIAFVLIDALELAKPG